MRPPFSFDVWRAHWKLVDRKEMLREIIPSNSQNLLYVDHIEGRGQELFYLACERDLEGIVAKWKRGAYISSDDRTSWLKIKNREYTHIIGRDKLFERGPAGRLSSIGAYNFGFDMSAWRRPPSVRNFLAGCK
jgi:hypothetical protein